MSNEELYPPPLDRLKKLGTPSVSRDVAELGLTSEHIPGMIRIVRKWLDWYLDEAETPDEPELWAPLHAWRSLGRLGAVEAVEPMLEMMDALDVTDDTWYLDEFSGVFALIGPDAADALQRYLADPSHRDYPRTVAADGLVRLAKRRPDCRAAAVAALGSVLAKYEENDIQLNGFLVAHLLELKAVEQAELIERAYAAGRVDDEICGYWDDVRKQLGVEGLGLVPDQPPRPRQISYLRFDGPEPLDKEERAQQRKQRKKLKAKRKQQQKARKKNRRGK